MSANELQTIVAKLSEDLRRIESGIPSEDARSAAISSARKLVAELEKPEETVMYHACVTMVQRTALKIAVDLKLFHVLSGSNSAISAAQIAVETKAEEGLITRILRVLASMSFIAQPTATTYAPTALSKTMTQPGMEAAVLVYDDSAALSAMPEYFAKNQYRIPTSSKDCPFQFAKLTDRSYFEYLHDNPEKLGVFHDLMGVIRNTRRFWADWFDVRGRLLNGFEDDGDVVFMVDVGGGNGHDLERLLERFPETKGKLVLQDQSSVVRGCRDKLLAKGIDARAHDFFTEQPIKGARVYFMHFCIHDWPDAESRSILRQFKAAMEPGYSKLVLNEAVLPDIGCAPIFAANDIHMMGYAAGVQRSKLQWRKLLESVGFEVVQISESPFEGDSEGVIEAILPFSK